MAQKNTPINTDTLFFELEQSRESLQFALQSAGMGTWDIDLETNMVHCSKEMLEIWNQNPDEFNGDRNKLQSKVHPDDMEAMKEAINHAIRTNSVYELVYRIFPSEGIQRWVKSRGRCTYSLHSRAPIRFSGIVFDITESKEKELALQMAFKERENFLSLAGHELKTPLTCLQLQLHVFESELKEKFPEAWSSGKISSVLAKQKEQIFRLSRILENVFAQSLITEGPLVLQRENVELVSLIEDVMDELKEIASSIYGSQLVLFKKAASIHGEWDKFRLEQVILNLLTNALRFGKERPITVEIHDIADDAIIVFRDSGSGIKEEDQKKIFERFGRSNDVSSGLGLGLHLSNNIVLSHGGKIYVKSEPSKGSEFTVILPKKMPQKITPRSFK